MQDIKQNEYKVFDMFKNQWALVTAGNIEDFNTCTIGWGSLGTIWGVPGKGREIVTVYVNPDRYTWEYLKKNEYFSVSFFPEKYRSALEYLGSHSGRDGNKVKVSKLMPDQFGQGVTYVQAELTFLCKKLYQAPFEREGLADEINNGIYKNWNPHWMFVGEIIDVEDKR
ncbi:MAG: flavin reductase [Lachnospiraceae bacterium]|nr:flavin reductase [Lachnospiraceae bacterium]